MVSAVGQCKRGRSLPARTAGHSLWGKWMKSVYRVLAYLVAVEVLIQGMAIAYAIAGLGNWVEKDGGVVNKALFENEDAKFGGLTGFIVHGINGMMVIPSLVLILLIVSFFTKLPGATKRAAILVGLVALQVFLGIFSHEVPQAVMLHVLNAFAIFLLALQTGNRLRTTGSLAAPSATEPARVTAGV